MDEYDHATGLDPRFRDLDTNRHVNSAVYVSYMEQARADYFEDVIGIPLADAEIVLAELSVDYAAPISLGESVTVHTRIPDLGESSFPMDHAVETDDRRAATGRVTIVPFDPETEAARPIPDSWRDAIQRHEPMLE